VKILQMAVWGAFAAIIAVIVFVKAGRGGGQSGGEQSAAIIKAGTGGLANLATSLEGG
jgi:hypothetical protein